MYDSSFGSTQTFALCLDIDFKRAPVLAFEAQLVADLAFTSLLQDDILTVLVIDVGVSLEQAVAGLDLNLARISLASQIELDHWDAQKLSVGAHVSWHWYLGILARVGLRKAL